MADSRNSPKSFRPPAPAAESRAPLPDESALRRLQVQAAVFTMALVAASVFFLWAVNQDPSVRRGLPVVLSLLEFLSYIVLPTMGVAMVVGLEAEIRVARRRAAAIAAETMTPEKSKTEQERALFVIRMARRVQRDTVIVSALSWIGGFVLLRNLPGQFDQTDFWGAAVNVLGSLALYGVPVFAVFTLVLAQSIVRSCRRQVFHVEGALP